MILRVMLVRVIIAASPIHSKVITYIPSGDKKGSMTVTESIPAGSHLFKDKEEILASITTSQWSTELCFMGITSLTQSYEGDYVCRVTPTSESYYGHLDGDPLLEIRGSVSDRVYGFSAKHDSGHF
jgi:hypothetical protein